MLQKSGIALVRDAGTFATFFSYRMRLHGQERPEENRDRLADVSTRRCVEKMYTNAITATILEPAKLPMIMPSDREAIAVALKTCNRMTPESARMVRIKNTLELHRV